jgi:riboflavin kinase/FMN adenylyltransferase
MLTDMKGQWFESKVYKGEQLGRTIGFPTLNLSTEVWPKHQISGVYASNIRIRGKVYGGVLYRGPKYTLEGPKEILEIFVFDFKQSVYAERVQFQIRSFIRKPRRFVSLNELKLTIQQDAKLANESLKQE